MSRDISWEELPKRLAQLAGRVPLPSGRTLSVIRSSLTLERGGIQRRVFVFVEDELDSVRIRTREDRIMIEVQQTSFIVLGADFTRAVETDMQGQWVDVEISLVPDVVVELQFEHFERLQADD